MAFSKTKPFLTTIFALTSNYTDRRRQEEEDEETWNEQVDPEIF